MRFKLTEIELRPVMAVGDIISKLDTIGYLPPKLNTILKRCLKELRPSKVYPDPVLMFGVAKLDDGRTYWTLTGFGLSKKKAPVRRTSVYSAEGNQVFSGGQNAVGSMHTMLGRWDTKLVKAVMNS